MNFNIRKENSLDYDKVKDVIVSAFDLEDRNNVFNESILVKNIRNSEFYINELSLVAEFNNKIIGHIMFTPMKVINNLVTYNSLALAPLSVHKDFQKQGIGKALVKEGIKVASELGFESIIVMGHLDYYIKFGFQNASKYCIGTTLEFNDEYLFVLELVKGSLAHVNGVVEYCAPFYDELGKLI